MQSLRLLAPAKLNLHLRVGPADQTGFHPLLSWMSTVGLFDTLTIANAPDGDALSLQCDDPQLLCDSSNLVVRAAEVLRKEFRPADRPNRSAQIQLEKRIPNGGGLGGGSSDAARTLLGLNRLWNLGASVDRLSRIAAELGSDVPFFLHGPSSICTGRGQVVRPIARVKPRWAVIILPGYGISTQAVYRKFDELGLGDRDAISAEPDWRQWVDLSAGPLLSRLVNDLEAPAFAICPQLEELKTRTEQTIGRIVRMSGSGSSLFTLFDDSDAAKLAVARIKEWIGVQALAVETAPVLDDDLKARMDT